MLSHYGKQLIIIAGSGPTGWSNLRGGADTTILLTAHPNPDSCGVAYLNGHLPGRGFTIGVVHTRCATGYYSFGHELAHMFGARHNREVENGSTPNTFNYGYLIRGANGRPSGFRTIMA